MQRRMMGWLVPALLALLLLAGCQSESVTPTPPPALPTATPAPATGQEFELGPEQRFEEGGFAFRPVVGYTLDDASSAISMEAPDAGPNTGPGFFLTAGSPESFGFTGEDPTTDAFGFYLGAMVPEVDSFVGDPRRVAVNQVPGWDVDFTVFGAEPRRGRITVLELGEEYMFIMLGLSPPERWDGEVKLIYRDLLESVTMLEKATP